MKLLKSIAFKYVQIKLKLLALISKKRAAREAFRLFCTPAKRVISKTSPERNTSEKLLCIFNNKKVYGRRHNAGQQKRALILHGFSSASHNFERYVDLLIAKNYEVFSFDAPAHGLSEGKTINAVEYSGLIKLLYAEYGPFHLYISHSFGGLALTLALEELQPDESTKLVLIAPATETTSAINSAFQMLSLRDDKLRNEFDQLIFNISGRQPEWFSVARSIKTFNAKILWIHDVDDDVTPYVDAEKILINKPSNLTFITTKGLGHRRIYRDPDVIKLVDNFV
jgi:alpha-beta hydrolase superfamily lysophospholipase